jgi:hypothetical protein
MRILMSTALAVAMATPVAAQNACEAFRKAPPVGSWVEYEFQGNGQSGRSKIAVVGTETRGGSELTWYEISFNAAGQSGVMKMLAEGGFYQAMADKKIVEMVIKAQGQPAMKFSGATIERMQSQMNSDPAAEFSKGCEDAERVGVESITVPAGTFRAVHFRVASGGNPGDAWIVEGLPFGMIRWTGSEGEAAELVDRGDDAVTQITETPMEMPGG